MQGCVNVRRVSQLTDVYETSTVNLDLDPGVSRGEDKGRPDNSREHVQSTAALHYSQTSRL